MTRHLDLLRSKHILIVEDSEFVTDPTRRALEAGGAFIIGDNVKGGLYSEYPSIVPSDWLNGEDMRHTFDFRGVYGTLLEQWMGLDPTEIVGGTYEQLRPFKTAVGA